MSVIVNTWQATTRKNDPWHVSMSIKLGSYLELQSWAGIVGVRDMTQVSESSDWDVITIISGWNSSSLTDEDNVAILGNQTPSQKTMLTFMTE